ncbi:MAG TPA: ABC transporter permease [Sulfurovum sp.]|nr:ABC transporter permease [Sulfurovum sp.]
MASISHPEFVRTIVQHYLKYDKDNPFIFIAAVMAFLGIAAGVMVMMIALGVTNGLQKEFKERLFVMNYPLTVVSYADGIDSKTAYKIKEKFPELRLSPYYTTQVITKNDNSIQGSMVYGVDFQKEAALNSVFAKVKTTGKSTSKYRMIIGEGLSVEMGAKAGEKLILYFSEQQAVGFATMPLQKRFLIDGTFKSGLQAYDKAIIYTTHKAFHSLLKRNPDKFDGIHIYSEKPKEIIDEISAMLPDDAGIEGWWQQNGNFFTVMEMEKKVYFLILLFIILIASLNIISSLLMTIMSRRSEIALMRTLGATKKEIQSIFYKLGLIIGATGISMGVLLGLLGMWLLKTFDIISIPEDVFGSARLPVDLPLSDFFMIIIGASIIILVSAIYPAKKAASTDPLNVLRNE